jgi:histidinol dehydrogenase
LEVSNQQIASAYQKVGSELVLALKLAVKRIRSFHPALKESIWSGITKLGSGQLICPLERISIFVPGGTACYTSTVLMTAIPAKVAAVNEIIPATPLGLNKTVPPPTLVASDIAEVDRIFSIGGAQAIAAFAFDTKSIPKLGKICGLGNIIEVLSKKNGIWSS